MVIGFKTSNITDSVYPERKQQTLLPFRPVEPELTGDVFIRPNAANNRSGIIFGMWKKFEESEVEVGKVRITVLKTKTSPEISVDAVINAVQYVLEMEENCTGCM